jgi:hypothetical protein
MYIRKIAAAATFATGAALALAPFASADASSDSIDSLLSGAASAAAADPAALDAATVVPITSTVSGEIASLNSLFTFDTTLAGVPSADIITAADGFKIINPLDVTTLESSNTLFDELVYGFNPSNLTTDPGAYDVLNGAISKFDDAINFGVYALENGGAALPAADFATDLFGISGTAATELAGESATQAITTLFTDGLSDLAGYF